jgi:hypothetical protein
MLPICLSIVPERFGLWEVLRGLTPSNHPHSQYLSEGALVSFADCETNDMAADTTLRSAIGSTQTVG